MSYRILDLYPDLSGTNCGDCGRPSCFAFAGAVMLEGEVLPRCPHLEPRDADAITSRMAPRNDKAGEEEARQLNDLRCRLTWIKSDIKMIFN